MASRKKVVDRDNPQWTAKDFARAREPEELLSPDVLAVFGKRRGPQRASKKVPVSIRLSPEVLSHFKGTGPGWQSRIDTTLKEVVSRRRKRADASTARPGAKKAASGRKRATGR